MSIKTMTMALMMALASMASYAQNAKSSHWGFCTPKPLMPPFPMR